MDSLLLAAADGGTFWMPRQASTFAESVDGLFYFIYWVSVIFFVPLMATMAYFGWKYRKRSDADRTHPIRGHFKLELLWSAIPGLILMVVFAWGLRAYMVQVQAPDNALRVHVVGQKWSWTFTYPNGGMEGNELVVPVNQPVELVMTSTDVIHSFFVPDFRVKRDVVPNRYTVIWFEATDVGEYQVFCAEYCGTQHSDMLATIRVVTQAEYEAHLAELGGCGEDQTLAECGEEIYASAGCSGCHALTDTAVIGPSFLNLFGRQEELADGTTVTVDESYLRESIEEPAAKIVAGFQNVMPSYAGRFDEEQMTALIEFIRSLSE